MECANELSFGSHHFQDGSFSQCQDRWCPRYLMILVNPLFPGLSFVCRVRVSVNIVRVDVERYQAQSFEGGRVHYGHVIGGVDADGGHIGASTGPNIGNTFLQHLTESGIYHQTIQIHFKLTF